VHAHVLVGAVELTDGQRQGCQRDGLVLMALAALYLLPTIVAAIRHVPNITSIAVINIFAGFTLWGWVSAMALACRHMDRSSPSPAPSYAPGWYPDPWMPARLRLRRRPLDRPDRVPVTRDADLCCVRPAPIGTRRPSAARLMTLPAQSYSRHRLCRRRALSEDPRSSAAASAAKDARHSARIKPTIVAGKPASDRIASRVVIADRDTSVVASASLQLLDQAPSDVVAQLGHDVLDGSNSRSVRDADSSDCVEVIGAELGAENQATIKSTSCSRLRSGQRCACAPPMFDTVDVDTPFRRAISATRPPRRYSSQICSRVDSPIRC